LNAQSGWVSGHYHDQYLQIDIGQNRTISGIVSQGHSDWNYWTTTFTVKVSEDGSKWKQIECGRIFSGNKDRNTMVRNMFADPVYGRYVRLYPKTWSGRPSLRAGVTLCEKKCSEARLDFQMDGFISKTGGPMLTTPWGEGRFIDPKGEYDSSISGTVLEYSHVKDARCRKKCEKRPDCVAYTARQGGHRGCYLMGDVRQLYDNSGYKSFFMTDRTYYKLRAPYGYRFFRGQGFDLAADSCVSSKTGFSLIMELRLERTTGWSRLLGSSSWGQKGFYVKDKKFTTYPTTTGLQCDEELKDEVFYKFGITRNSEGEVVMYLNGRECAKATPGVADHFAFDTSSIIVLHDGNHHYEAEGFIRRLMVWSKVLRQSQMAKLSGCVEGIYSKKECKKQQDFVPDAKRITFSSIRDRNQGRFGQGRGINSGGSWTPARNSVEEYYQVDFGSNTTLHGMKTQGDSGNGWGITSFIVKISYNKKTWISVECRRVFSTPWQGAGQNEIHNTVFQKPVKARYLRIYPLEWQGAPSLRMTFSKC